MPRVVSPTFCELSNIIWRKYTMPENTFILRISSWKFVRGAKAWPWAHVQIFSLKFSQNHENVSETLPRLLASPGHQQPWYWLCRIGRPLSYLRKCLNYLCHINVKEWHKMLILVYVPSERVNRLLVSCDEVWLNILGEIGQVNSCLRFLCRQVISGCRVIIINDTKCKYTFNFAKINSACKAGKFVQVGSIIMCTCINNGIMAYQYFSSKLMG